MLIDSIFIYLLEGGNMTTGFIPVYVPERFYATIVSEVARLLGTTSISREESEWTEEALRRLYFDSQPLEEILVALARRPGEWLTTGDLAEAMGPDATWRSVAALLGQLTRKRKSYGFKAWPFELRTDPKTGRYSYMMSAKTAEIVLRVHEEVEKIIREAPDISELRKEGDGGDISTTE
jgi:hypothetical protein